MQIVGAIPAVKFGEIETQRSILEHGQDAIADVFIRRHPAFNRTAVGAHHARSEHRAGLTLHNRVIQMRKNFRRILPVAMQQDHNIEALIDEILVAGLLIPAVSQVLPMLQDVEFGKGIQRFQSHGELIGCILAGVVEDGDLFHVLPDPGSDAFEYPLQRSDRVISHNQNPNPLTLAWRYRGVALGD